MYTDTKVCLALALHLAFALDELALACTLAELKLACTLAELAFALAELALACALAEVTLAVALALLRDPPPLWLTAQDGAPLLGQLLQLRDASLGQPLALRNACCRCCCFCCLLVI